MENKKNKNIFREFGLTSLSVDNSTSVFILTLIIIMFGWQSYTSMPKELFPELVIPTIYVGTPYPGTSAADVENLVTKPLEEEIQSVDGVKEIKSTNIQGYSTIIVEFGTDVKIPQALADVKDAVDLVKSVLPSDLPADPSVFDVNLSEIPVVTVNLSGEYTVDELRGYAEYLQDKIKLVSEVSKVEIKGALDREVKINVDPIAMEARQVSFDDISNAIQSENLNVSGGELKANGFKRAIRVIGEFRNTNEIANIVVKSENQNPVYLRDIAKVTLGFEEASSYARSDGLPVVALDVVKKKGENLLNAIDDVRAIVEEAKKSKLPAELSISYFNDQSIDVRKQVSELENSIISGVILVVLVLMFFLGARNAMFVGLAIPLSMLMGILILNLLGVTLNLMVLFSLILALGMLVDNGIVIVENIYRYMQEGYSGWEAAKKGGGEVAVAIIVSTATTLAAFAPLAFWDGMIGSFMFYLPITLIIVLLSSLFVALVINPVFTATMMKVDEQVDSQEGRRRRWRKIMIWAASFVLIVVMGFIFGWTSARNVGLISIGITLVNAVALRPATFAFQNSFLPWLERIYDKFISFALKGYTPAVIFVGTIGLLFLAFILLAVFPPQTVLFPKTPPKYVNVFVELPIGTDIAVTNKMALKIEDRISNTIEPYRVAVDAVLTQVGEGTADPSMPAEPGNTPNKARITVSFVVSEKREGINTAEIMDKIRKDLQGGFPGVNIVVDQDASGPPTGKPINLEITGEDIDKLAELSQDIFKTMNAANVEGVEELQLDVRLGKPELIIDIDREAARRYGLSTYAIGMAVRTSVFGKETTKMKVGKEEYPIQIRLDEKYRNNVGALLNQRITFRDPGNGQISQVPISAVADVRYSTTYNSIKRTDLDRSIAIYSNVLDGYNPTELIAELEDVLADYDMPEGYYYKFTGEQEEQAEAMAFLGSAFLIAFLMIFLILVAQFNSILYPFIIILSIVFSTIGVFLGLVITQMDFVVIMTGIGIISLAGIVVNNAIVLVDYINFLRATKRANLGLERGESLSNNDVKEAIVQAGKTRLRPVLLTAITTVLGLIPLAVGFNINFGTLISDFDPQIFIGGDNVAFWGPMSWTVINGLVFATFLTLIVVPVMYWLFYRLSKFVVGLAK